VVRDAGDDWSQLSLQRGGPAATIVAALSVPGASIHVLGGALVAVLAAGAVLAAPTASASPSPGTLSQGIAASSARERALQTSIAGASRRIVGYQGAIDDLRRRLAGIEQSLGIERRLLARLHAELRAAHARLAILRERLARDKRLLAAQIVAAYESPHPDIVSVAIEAHDFADLLERVGDMHAIARQNTAATLRVANARRAVAVQVKRLGALEGRHQRIATGMLIQRDQVAQVQLAVVDRQARAIRARSQLSGALARLRTHRQALERELSSIRAREAAAQAAPAPASGGAAFTPDGGSYGFFPAAGTNYSVGEEPELARRLDRLGKALHLHLIGISGYRSPQHSVEVGGFANDPHTRGEASDTPGVEGVPEATLRRFGLTRPFPGAAEADHIQLG
jgi:peptidoglycan hydrolase CwlO-like protein